VELCSSTFIGGNFPNFEQKMKKKAVFSDGNTGLIFLSFSFRISLVGLWNCPATRQGGNHMKKRILVVDDDGMNLSRTKIILGKDYDVLLASSGMECLAVLKTEKVDMVLLDIDMPGMNGMETFERMKDYEANVPVIFLTASGLEEDVVTAIKLGAANYLKKPFRPQELIKRVTQEFEKL
jgi:CheY-like chemotaxis protein